MTLTNFPNGVSSFGVPVIGGIGGIPFTGTWFFVNPATGSDGNEGTSPDAPLATLYRAHQLMTSGNNDVCVLVGNGGTSATARLSTALAQTIDSSVTAGTLNWTKNACHLIGQTAPTAVAQRARIAPPSGTYTQTTFGSGNFVVVSGQGCVFANFSLFNGFSTGGNNQICWTDSGGRNYYYNVDFGGAADAASAGSTSSRSLKVSGSTGENTFDSCVVGLDTVARTAANSSLEFSGGSPRNVFRNCVFPVLATGSGSGAFFVSAGAAAIDRFALFKDCTFINAIKSTGVAMTGAFSVNAAPGGLILLQRCTIVGATDIEASASNNIFIDGGAPTATTTALAINNA